MASGTVVDDLSDDSDATSESDFFADRYATYTSTDTETFAEALGAASDQVQANILVPGNMIVEDFVIPTSNMMEGGGYTDDPDLFGFMAGDPDNNPDTVELASLATAGYRGEGMRGVKASEEGERQTAAALPGTSLDTSTMGIGYINTTTNHEGYSTSAKLFFNYSNISDEPILRITKGDVHQQEDIQVTYNIGYTDEGGSTNPIEYSEDETSALISKFGWDVTLGTGAYTSRIKDGIDRSTQKIVESLITTYPVKLATFPRTPPMKIRKSDFAEISDTEAAEGAAPTGTTAVESRLVIRTTRGSLKSTTGPMQTSTIVTGGGTGGGSY